MEPDTSRTYDIKVGDGDDDGDNSEQIVNNKIIINEVDEAVDSLTHSNEHIETHSDDLVLQAQLCNSCKKEKATVICTLCILDSSTSFFVDHIPAVMNDSNRELGDEKNEEEYNQNGQTDVEKYPQANDECTKSQSVSVEQLIKSRRKFSFLKF